MDLLKPHISGYGAVALLVFIAICLVFLVARKQSWAKFWAAPVVLFFWGVMICFWQSITSKFDLLPGDYGDGKVIHYFLEHGWLWISGNSLHANFWDAPFFYPHANTMAYSDILLGSAPLYWAARLMQFDVFNAFLFWSVALSFLNFFCMFFFLRRAMHFAPLSSALGAFLFTFCAPRIIKIGHIQMWAQFYSVLFLWCVNMMYKDREINPFRSRIFMTGATLCFVLQFYSSFYLGWFLTFGSFVFLLCSLCFLETRQSAAHFFMQHYFWIFCCLIISILLLSPMAWHYMQAQALFGGRPFADVLNYTPTLQSWLNNPGALYSWFGINSAPNFEHFMGIGLASLAMCLLGLSALRRRNLWGRCLVLSLVVVFFLTLMIYNGIFWKILVFSWFPGASAIRALARIFFLALLILPIGLAFALENKRAWLQSVMVLLCLVESFCFGYIHYDKNRVLNESVAIAAEAKKYDLPFLFLPITDVGTETDSMWASILADRPTINGYSGWDAPGYNSIKSIDVMELQDERFFPAYLNDLMDKALLIFRSSDGTMTSRVIMPVSGHGGNMHLDFRGTHPSEAVSLTGFSGPESDFTWTDGETATITLKSLPPNQGRVRLRAGALGPNAGQDFVIHIGDYKSTFRVGDLFLDGPSEIEIPYSSNEPVTAITIIVPEPVTPLSLGINSDVRRLGLAVSWLEFLP